MPVIKLTLEDLPRMLEEDRKAFPRQVREALQTSAKNAVPLLKSKTPIAYDTLRKSWGWVLTYDGATVANDAPYASAVEGGATPYVIGREGIDRLIGWAMKKFGVESSEARGIAFAVAKKLKVYGQPGKFFVFDTLPELQRRMQREIRKRLGSHRKNSTFSGSNRIRAISPYWNGK